MKTIQSKLAKQRNEIGRLQHAVEALQNDKKVLVDELYEAKREGRRNGYLTILTALNNGASAEDLRTTLEDILHGLPTGTQDR